MIRMLLVTHGDLGSELLSTAQLIVGPQDGVRVLSNKELSAESLSDALQKELHSYGEDEVVVFVDVAGGSCLSACRVAQESLRIVKVISGVNLPMVLEFFHYRAKMPFDELVERILTKGKVGIQAM
jgi:PTS system mannose-specific IIA component